MCTCVQDYKMVSYAMESAVNIFIDQGKFEAMKILSGCRALCCGKHQFQAKVTVST